MIPHKPAAQRALQVVDRALPATTSGAPGDALANLEDRRVARLVAGIALMATVLCAVSVVFTAREYGVRNLTPLALGAMTLGFLAAMIGLRSEAWVRRAAKLFVLITVFGELVIAVAMGGIHSPQLVFFGLSILMAGFLGGRQLSLWIAGLCLAALGAFYGLDRAGVVLVAPLDPAPMLSALIIHSLDVISIAGMVLLYEGARRRAMKDLESTNQKLLSEMHLREQVEARLTHAQRLEALGRLAGGIAHEINNPLSVVLSNLRFIGEVLQEQATPNPGPDDLVQVTAAALDGAERIRRIVRDVKVFAQAEAAVLAPVELPRVMERALAMARAEIAQRGSVSIHVEGVPAVLASEEGLVQVFYNLLVNAAQALNPGRHATNRIDVTARLLEDGRVEIQVQDNGGGIRSKDLPRVFEPFFTTRDVGAGTGLGLCICHGIITNAGGEISVVSEVGVGTTFRVLLPAGTVARRAAA